MSGTIRLMFIGLRLTNYTRAADASIVPLDSNAVLRYRLLLLPLPPPRASLLLRRVLICAMLSLP